MNLFWKKSTSAVSEVAKEVRSPVVQYVDGLVSETLRNGVYELTLYASDPLPILADQWQLSEEIDFDHVRNRLKVMAGLDPIAYHEPKMGTTKLDQYSADGATVNAYAVRFEFRDADRYSQIDVHFTPVGSRPAATDRAMDN